MSTATLTLEPTTLRAFGGFSAHMEDTPQGKALIVHRVPIFCECERPDHDISFDRDWIGQAVEAAKRGESEGYLPPLHVVHHGSGEPVRRAGMFRVTGTGSIQLHGTPRLAIFADLIVTDPAAIEDVLAGRLPYRSVEIFKRDVAKIDTLALLEHEAPYLELPLLMISKLRDGDSSLAKDFTFQRFALSDSSSLVAFSQSGGAARLLFRNEGSESVMADYEDKKDEKEGGEKMEAAPALDVSAVLKAIKDRSISVADMDAICAAIAESRNQAAEPSEEKAPEVAAVQPPGMAMQARDESETVQFARLTGELEALKMQLRERDAAEQRTKDVSAAVKRFANRATGSDFEAQLLAFHREHGPKAFAVHVDTLDKFVGVPPAKDNAAHVAPASVAPAIGSSPIVAKFANEGAEVVAFAAERSAMWRELNARGMTKLGEEQYIRAELAREKHLAGTKGTR